MVIHKINIIKVVLTLTVFITNSCTKIVEIDIPQVKQKPTLYSLVGNSTQIRVSIGKSYEILEYVETDTLPENEPADVKLFVNNGFSKTFYNNGSYYYVSGYFPNYGDSLKIIARTNKGDTLVASTYIPEKILLDSVTLLDSAFLDEEGYLRSQITINFTDIPNTNNYYEVYFSVLCDAENSNEYNLVYDYKSTSPIILNENILEYEPQSILFSDQMFDGEDVSIPISFAFPCFDDETGDYLDSDFSVIVYFLNVTNDYYLYRKTLYKQVFSQHAGIWDLAIEPINIHSNVSGGYGVFAGYSHSEYYLHSN